MTDTIHSCSYYCQIPDCIKAQRDELRDKLYQRTWVGLSGEDVIEIIGTGDTMGHFIRSAEAKLKEKNGIAPQAKEHNFKAVHDLHLELSASQPKQEQGEPDYWLGYGLQAHTEKPFEGATPLYTTPRKSNE